MRITFTRQATKTLRRMQPHRAGQIRAAIDKLAEDPARDDLDIRTLTGGPGYRLRIGGWRVIYTVDGLVLAIERIGPRGGVY